MKRFPSLLARNEHILPFLFAILTTTLVTALLLLIRSQVEIATVALLYLFPVGASAALWGLWPGIMAALSAFFSFNYFFLPPYGTLMVHNPQNILELVVFLVLTFFISQLVGRMTYNLNTAHARENEITQLFELSQALSKQYLEKDILDNLARHLLQTFQLDQVEILAETDPHPILVRYPESPHPDIQLTPQPAMLISMQGTAHLLGELRLWRQDHPFSSVENRLLRTSASQGVMALERARLTASESRARILEESDHMKSSLLSSVSHELRTPLATIKAAVTSLRSEEITWESEARLDLLAAMDEESDRLNQLVGNLLNMSRIEAGALHLKCNWNELAEIAAGAVQRARLASPGHVFKMDIPEDFPLIFVDDVLMEQVFNNLLSNSMKYSPPGTTIQVKARQNDATTIWVQVNNQGPVVSEPDLQRIFDKFHRVTAADQITGTGLGLSICKGIIEAHQGTIRAENMDQGFSIQFTLPIHAGGAVPRIPSQ